MGQACCGTKPDEAELNAHKTQGARGEHRNYDPVVELFSMGGSREPSRKSSLHQLLSNNEGSVKGRTM